LQGASRRLRKDIMQIIEFRSQPAAADRPDNDFVSIDQNGQEIYRFALQYDWDDKLWAAEIWAYSLDDAETRVQAMRQSLTVCGQLYSGIGCEAVPLIPGV
jgi:hypothetical protein